ncbi:hypothetical protein [Saccharothrix variisporea]|uniref:C1q domain-containing protein n=1 Tax=Saccharothrix variisporea TaxID=543527 RepID=A0A495X6J1_9PSEU|nr:hypothetical protein [Saccharothrix variisporea]RKT67118.1 hypothetical protein DFJ66_0286 [Saccharothrix variisporea]
MATSLTTYAPFDSGAGASVTESTWRSFMKYMIDTGPLANVLNEFEVYADSSGMQVKVKSGECWIQGHWGQKTTETTLAISSNSTGSTRIDRVILRANFTTDVIELDVLTGTASAPAVTTNTSVWEVSLATVSVANGAVTIAAGNVTDDRRRVSATRDAPRAQLRQGSAQGILHNNFTSVTYGSEDHDSHNAHSTSTNPSRYVAPVAGVYQLSGAVSFDVNSTGARGCRWAKNGTEINGSQVLHATSGSTVSTIVAARTVQVRLAVNDYVELQAYQDSGVTLNSVVSASQQPSMTVTYVGS